MGVLGTWGERRKVIEGGEAYGKEEWRHLYAALWMSSENEESPIPEGTSKGTSWHVKENTLATLFLAILLLCFKFLIPFQHLEGCGVMDLESWWQCYVLVRAWGQPARDGTSWLPLWASDFLFIKWGQWHPLPRFPVRLELKMSHSKRLAQSLEKLVRTQYNASSSMLHSSPLGSLKAPGLLENASDSDRKSLPCGSAHFISEQLWYSRNSLWIHVCLSAPSTYQL